MKCVKTRDRWDEDDDVFVRDAEAEDREESHELLTLHCNYPGCCMPGEHYPSECHNAEDMQAMMRDAFRKEAEEQAACYPHFPRNHDPSLIRLQKEAFIDGYIAAKTT